MLPHAVDAKLSAEQTCLEPAQVPSGPRALGLLYSCRNKREDGSSHSTHLKLQPTKGACKSSVLAHHLCLRLWWTHYFQTGGHLFKLCAWYDQNEAPGRGFIPWGCPRPQVSHSFEEHRRDAKDGSHRLLSHPGHTSWRLCSIGSRPLWHLDSQVQRDHVCRLIYTGGVPWWCDVGEAGDLLVRLANSSTSFFLTSCGWSYSYSRNCLW